MEFTSGFESERIKKEKIQWKHKKDEELRVQLLCRLREKVMSETPAPELFDERKATNERDLIERAMETSELSDRTKNQMRVEKDHRLKYQKFWEKSHAAKLSDIRRYDLTEARERGNQKSNIMILKQSHMQLFRKTTRQKDT